MPSKAGLPRDGKKLSFVHVKKHRGEKLYCSGCCSPCGSSWKNVTATFYPKTPYCSSFSVHLLCLLLETSSIFFKDRCFTNHVAWSVCSCWELSVPLKPSTKVLLNNGICPLPDGCADRSGKRLGLAGSQEGRWAARVNALVMRRRSMGSAPGGAGLAQQLQTGLRGAGPNFPRPKIISDLKGQVSCYLMPPKKKKKVCVLIKFVYFSHYSFKQLLGQMFCFMKMPLF